MNWLLTFSKIPNWGPKSGFITFQVLMRLWFEKIKKIKREITVTERQTDRECATIINISINEHNIKILFPQKVEKEKLKKKCNTCM